MCCQKRLWPPWSHGKWMNLADFLHADPISGKLRLTLIVFGWLWLKMGIVGLYFVNEWMILADFLHANTYYSRKLKVTLIVVGWVWSNMGLIFHIIYFRSWDSIICCISRTNKWIELRKTKSYSRFLREISTLEALIYLPHDF